MYPIDKSEINQEINSDLLKQAAYWELNYININNNWSETASTYEWCSGSGTLENPYIIENITITLGSSEFGIKVQNSAQYFIIQNCTVNNQANGIYLVNCSNGLINNNSISLHSNAILIDECYNLILSNNEISESSYGIRALNGSYNRISYNLISECGYGVFIFGSKFIIDNNHLINNLPSVYLFGKGHELFNNTLEDSGIYIGSNREEVISYNIDTSNTLNNKPIYYYANKTNLTPLNFINAGQILLANCNNSKVADLSFTNTGLPILMVYCSNNEISNISIMNEIYGMALTGCEYNTFKNNDIEQCGMGIWLLGHCNNNEFIENRIINTTWDGIRLGNDDSNVFINNLFKDNQQYGLSLSEYSDGNLMYKNLFLNNSDHAYDEGISNYWDNGTVGNYWDDYKGLDLNGDGIGDSPYNISGPVLNQDKYPLVVIPNPQVSILTPTYLDIFGVIPPQIVVSLQSVLLDEVWYNLDDGTTLTNNLTFSGNIDSESWAQIMNGTLKISVFANDSFGNIVTDYVIVRKDIIKPAITINFPQNNQEFDDPPQFTLSIQEHNLDEFWYTIDNGANNYTISSLTGTINQDAWDAVPDGPVTINFYARDVAGNIGTNSVIVAKISSEQQTPPPGIPGYNLIALIGVTLAVSLILTKKKHKK